MILGASAPHSFEGSLKCWYFVFFFRVAELNEQVELLHDEKKDLEESVTYKDNEIEVSEEHKLLSYQQRL